MTATETFVSTTARPMTVTISDVLRGLQSWYRSRRDVRDARAAFLHTLYLNDRLLDDMGVTREEVRWAASLPIEENAALALRARAARRQALQSKSVRADM